MLYNRIVEEWPFAGFLLHVTEVATTIHSWSSVRDKTHEFIYGDEFLRCGRSDVCGSMYGLSIHNDP